MADRNATYDRAVQRFLALVGALYSESHRTPRSLARAVGLPHSSGYRTIHALESAGFLRRDSLGAYLSGDLATRIGLSAFGLGRLAPIAAPIVDQLRQDTTLTSFLGIRDERRVTFGPFAMGHFSREVVPDVEASYPVLAEKTVDPAQLLEIGEPGASLSALVVPIHEAAQPDAQPVLGLLFRPDQVERLETLGLFLVEAARRAGEALPPDRPGQD